MCKPSPLPVSEVRAHWRRWPSSERRMRAPAWSAKAVKRSGEDAADVLMLRGVLGPLSLSLHRAHKHSQAPTPGPQVSSGTEGKTELSPSVRT